MVKNPAPITTDFVYVRLIGDRELPDDAYDHTVRDQSKVIAKWADKIKKLDESKMEINDAQSQAKNMKRQVCVRFGGRHNSFAGSQVSRLCS